MQRIPFAKVISMALQRGMRSSQPFDLVITLDCDRAPYLS